jgi:mono/diheme cytochrome c family protein
MTLPPRLRHPQRKGDTRAIKQSALAQAALATVFVVLACANRPLAQVSAGHELDLKTGRDVFTRGCITCHGPEGKGMPRPTSGFEPPKTFPDFTGCVATVREADDFWRAIVTNGGPARGFSEIMPSFRELLTPEQITMVVQFLRGFCREPAWPRGDLNLPRALVAEKAFPEDEVLVTTGVSAKGESAVETRIAYERRYGARNQLEVAVPFTFQPQESGTWFGGVGDIALGFKRVLISNLRTGSILGVQGEAILPTGNQSRGFGKGVTILEAFGSYGQLITQRNFLQVQAGVEVPVDTANVNRALYWRTMIGRSMNQDQGLGRMWSPMVELLADRELATGERINWDVVPQCQVTLSTRQHLRVNAGLKIPLNDYGSRPMQFLVYFLWDWFDGGLRDGW